MDEELDLASMDIDSSPHVAPSTMTMTPPAIGRTPSSMPITIAESPSPSPAVSKARPSVLEADTHQATAPVPAEPAVLAAALVPAEPAVLAPALPQDHPDHASKLVHPLQLRKRKREVGAAVDLRVKKIKLDAGLFAMIPKLIETVKQDPELSLEVDKLKLDDLKADIEKKRQTVLDKKVEINVWAAENFAENNLQLEKEMIDMDEAVSKAKDSIQQAKDFGAEVKRVLAAEKAEDISFKLRDLCRHETR